MSAEDMPPPELLASLMTQSEAKEQSLINIIQDFHWMARRYADGRSTYAPDTLNRRTRELLAMGIRLKMPLYARDGMGRSYDGLTEKEAADAEDDMPRGHLQSVRETEQRTAALVRERAAALDLLAKIHNAFVRDTDGGHYAYLGGTFYDEIKGVLGIDRPNVVDG